MADDVDDDAPAAAAAALNPRDQRVGGREGDGGAGGRWGAAVAATVGGGGSAPTCGSKERGFLSLAPSDGHRPEHVRRPFLRSVFLFFASSNITSISLALVEG